MSQLSQTLIPGIVILVFGVVLIIKKKEFYNSILESHHRFWKGIMGVDNNIGRFGELFLNFLIIFLGTSFLIAGIVLISQYFTH